MEALNEIEQIVPVAPVVRAGAFGAPRFEPTFDDTGGIAGPADPAAGAADPGIPVEGTPVQGDVAGAAPADPWAGIDPAQFAQLVESNRRMADVFNEALQGATPQSPAPPYGQPQPPAQPAAPQQPQADPLAEAIAGFDPWQPGSLQNVLSVQQQQMEETVRGLFTEFADRVLPTLEDFESSQGEAQAKQLVGEFRQHDSVKGQVFDDERALDRAAHILAANPQLDERSAVWYAIHQEIASARHYGEVYTGAYRSWLSNRAGAGGEPTAAAASAEGEPAPPRLGPGKYAARVHQRMAAERGARQPMSV